MIIGSAGYTAALCVLTIKNKIKPKHGYVLVTGASGGVGSIAINLLSNLGYDVVALSAKDKEYLHKLGAIKVLSRKDYKINKKPYQNKNGLVVLIQLVVKFFQIF